jgi:outer membrane protein assembly factor BamE (lipoprotein component of BamABCDE complex)
MKKITLLLTICCIAVLTGCTFSSGTQVKQSDVSKIQKGVTTKQDLNNLFGAPDSSSFDSDGKEIEIWSYWKQNNSGTDYIPIYGAINQKSKMTSSELKVTLNKDKIVEDYSLTESSNSMK